METARGNTWHFNASVSEQAGSVCEHERDHRQHRETQAEVEGSAGGLVGLGGTWWDPLVGGVSPYSLPSWKTKRPRQVRTLMSPTVPYPPNSPTSCPCRSDVTGQLGMSRPHPSIPSVCPLSQLGFNHWSPTVTADNQWSTYQTQRESQPRRNLTHIK